MYVNLIKLPYLFYTILSFYPGLLIHRYCQRIDLRNKSLLQKQNIMIMHKFTYVRKNANNHIWYVTPNIA